MTGGKVLLLLAALLSVVRCQQTLKVSMSPKMTPVFIGDLIHLNCDNSRSSVEWLFNNEPKGNNKTLRIAAASQKDSGTYSCKSNGNTSEGFVVKVTEYAPSASLTITTGHPVVGKGGSVNLKLENDDGLKGWSCRVNRGRVTRVVRLKVADNPVSLPFTTTPLWVPETIYWCINGTENFRSNQVTIRTSVQRVSLEMYPLPAVAGQSLTLECLAWGTNEIASAVFYKDDIVIKKVQGPSYKINNMTESQGGRYKCNATYRYTDQTVPHHTDTSDVQELPVYVGPQRAVLSEDMSCSCPSCRHDTSYTYYQKTADSWTKLSPDKKPDSSGTYRCRAVMRYMRTLPSHALYYNPMKSVITIILLLVGLVFVFVALFACFFYHRRRRGFDPGPIYEDVALRPHGEDKTETRGGEYEQLKKEGAKEAEYDTLKTEGASGGEGGYQELKKEGRKEGEYDTLKTEGASGGEGGYQELKKEGRKEDVYHSLGDHLPAAGGEGGYEALKKEEIQKSEYETLQAKEAEESSGGDTKTTE